MAGPRPTVHGRVSIGHTHKNKCEAQVSREVPSIELTVAPNIVAGGVAVESPDLIVCTDDTEHAGTGAGARLKRYGHTQCASERRSRININSGLLIIDMGIA